MDFYNTFNSAAANIKTSTDSKALLLSRISNLEKSVKNVQSTLPAHDIEYYLSTIKDLYQTVQARSQQTLKKFRFSTRLSDALGEENVGNKNSLLHGDDNRNQNKDDIKYKRHNTVPPNLLLLRPEKLTALYKSAQIWHLNYTEQVVSVDGPIYISGCDTSMIVGKCQQFRMHECVDCIVYLECNTRPIIEGCNNIKFVMGGGVEQESIDDFMDLERKKMHYQVIKKDQLTDKQENLLNSLIEELNGLDEP